MHDRAGQQHPLARIDGRHHPSIERVERLALEPGAGHAEGQEGELGLGDDPAEVFLERGRVALSAGPAFGEPGQGFARLNIGTSSGLLEEAVRRMAASL